MMPSRLGAPRKRLALDLLFMLLCVGGVIFALATRDAFGAIIGLPWVIIYAANSRDSLRAVRGTPQVTG